MVSFCGERSVFRKVHSSRRWTWLQSIRSLSFRFEKLEHEDRGVSGLRYEKLGVGGGGPL